MEFLVGLIFQGQRGIEGLCTKALETDFYNLSFYIFCILRLSVNLVAEFLFGHCPGFTWQGFGIWGCRGAQGERRPGSAPGLAQPDTACSRTGPSWAKAELTSEAGTPLR